jgi:hypothetical protein
MSTFLPMKKERIIVHLPASQLLLADIASYIVSIAIGGIVVESSFGQGIWIGFEI